ncbi:hypothetical protein [Planktothricoides raciborskii]|uniref:Uncharacterized protein n=1 Tax=Planktothricoides raciborskii GIHE-MW2 TaxID=2792601 RepID=A0AAU8JJA3_9CYAN
MPPKKETGFLWCRLNLTVECQKETRFLSSQRSRFLAPNKRNRVSVV